MLELKALKELNHQHLVKIVGSYTDTHYIAYIMSPVATFTLGDFLASKKKLDDGEMAMLRRFYGCLAAAVNYLHQSRVRHNDITRRNVLIDRGEVYIADFGSCHRWNTQTPLGSRTHHVNTGVSPDYMAPEIARPDSAVAPKGRAADMWSLGVLFLEMTTRLLGRQLGELQASLRASASKISKPGFLYANPQFVAEWMGTLRQSSHISQHDNEPLQWIRVLLQKSPSLRFTSITLMNRILDSPSFTEFHCFKCHGEFVNSQLAHQSHGAPRFDPEDKSQALIDTVGDVFEDPDKPRTSQKKMDFIEQWRAGTIAPIIPGSPENDDEGDDEPVDIDALSLNGEAEEFLSSDDRYMATEQLFYGLSGLPSVPEYPQGSPTYPEKDDPADEVSPGAPVYTWNQNQDRISDPSEGTLIDSNSKSRLPDTAPSSKGSDSAVLFEEVESASSNDAEDDVRVFEEISDRSDSSSDISRIDPSALSDIEEDSVLNPVLISEDEAGTSDPSMAQVRAVENDHGMFVEEEEVSASETNESLSDHGITQSGDGEKDIAKTDPHKSEVFWVDPPGAANSFGENPKEEATEPHAHNPPLTSREVPPEVLELQAGDTMVSKTSQTVPDINSEEGPTDPKAALRKRKAKEQSDIPQVEGPVSPITPQSKQTRSVRFSSSPPKGEAHNTPEHAERLKETAMAVNTGNNPAVPTRDGIEASTIPLPEALPSINIQPPDNEPARPKKNVGSKKNKSPSITSGGASRLSKKNLKNMTPRRPKERDPVTLLNPVSFLKATGDNASSIATSVISDNTKKSITNLGLPVKQADKLKDFLSLYCGQGKAGAVRWLLSEGCNPGTEKKRRAGPIVRAVRGRSRRHIKCVGALIQMDVDLNVTTSKSGKTPLHFAIENDNFDGYEKLVWLLIEHGAQVNKKSRGGETALMILFSKANEKAFEKHHLQALAILLNAGAKVNRVLPGTGDTLLHMAVRNKDDWATTMLLHKGADVTAKNASGTTPIQVTANQFRGFLSREHGTVLNILLKYIADKDKTAIDQGAGTQNRTALHHAVTSGTAQAVELLLDYGASPLAKDKQGHNALHHALASAEKLTSVRPIEDHVEVMERLTKATSREWPVDRGVCALELACADKKLMSSLLVHGLNPNTMFKGSSLLSHALKRGSKGVVEVLQQKGAIK